jgi:ribosomal protein S15
MQQRIAANEKRRDELRREKDAFWGDQIHGIPTPFVESFDSAGQVTLSEVPRDEDGNPLSEPYELPTSPHILNHLLSREELDEAIKHSYILTKPIKSAIRDLADPAAEEEEEQAHEANHKKAVEALNRIVSMDIASSKMRRHANIRRCIETFGRHITDQHLRPMPLSIGPKGPPMPGRSGPDTGSSEVQIAILTAKIRKLAQELGKNRGQKDKHNKRNLRVLCHRRQRLLKYMERKERGSERWTHMLEKLGLSPATWKEQISF